MHHRFPDLAGHADGLPLTDVASGSREIWYQPSSDNAISSEGVFMTDIAIESDQAGGVAFNLSESEREALLEYHPVREREYILPTPMMERAYSIIRERVWARRTGSVFYASPRTGKTRCALAVKDMLEGEFPKCYVTLASVRKSSRATDGHMSRLILEAEHHVLSSRSNADALFDNVVADIEVKTKGRGGNQYVLLLDEMQVLNDLDLQQLTFIHNALELKKIRMTTISFAQPEIVHRRTALMASNDRHLIARFMSELVAFSGCSSSADLRHLLRAYDAASEFPEGSGCSFTRFFLPLAFQNGFRLESYTIPLWATLSKAAGVGSGGMIPMEHTCLSIENLLLATRKQDCATFVLGDDDLEDAVESSQLSGFNPLMATEE
jgi:hypothetical protein